MPQSRETKDIWLISGRVATSEDAQWPHIFLMIAAISLCRTEHSTTLVFGSHLTGKAV
jgi:hypothetical protein